MCSLSETQIWDHWNTVLRFYWLSYPATHKLPPLVREQFNTVTLSFSEQFGIRTCHNFESPEEFFNISFTPSFFYVYLLALIALEFHSLHPLSGDNLVICYLSLWEICRNLYDKIFKIEHVLSLTSGLKVYEIKK
jgi:hypothetical protein